MRVPRLSAAAKDGCHSVAVGDIDDFCCVQVGKGDLCEDAGQEKEKEERIYEPSTE
jgi:hypothetical protein